MGRSVPVASKGIRDLQCHLGNTAPQHHDIRPRRQEGRDILYFIFLHVRFYYGAHLLLMWDSRL